MNTGLQLSQGSFLLDSCMSKKKGVKLILFPDSLQHLLAKFKVECLAPERYSLFITPNTKRGK